MRMYDKNSEYDMINQSWYNESENSKYIVLHISSRKRFADQFDVKLFTLKMCNYLAAIS